MSHITPPRPRQQINPVTCWYLAHYGNNLQICNNYKSPSSPQIKSRLLPVLFTSVLIPLPKSFLSCYSSFVFLVCVDYQPL